MNEENPSPTEDGSEIEEATEAAALSPHRPEGPTLVVGIGASAGGLEAYRMFFAAMPADSGMAFILVQHLHPDHASTLPEILRRSTSIPVEAAHDGEVIAPNHIYVIPPDTILTVGGGTLHLETPASLAARRTSVDTFLASLARDQRHRAVGIILAGFGVDGSAGVEAIKENGGLTLSQAEFDHSPKAGMPQSATASGFVDHVLPVEKMPAILMDTLRYQVATQPALGGDGTRQDLSDHLGAICAILNGRLGRDFSHYKPNTLMRRIQRRMQVLQIADAPTYVQQLRERGGEAELLFREVLIRVTQFFRDRNAFEALAPRIAELLAHGDAREPVRVWVPGCATGEEAYSLAILFREAMARAEHPRKVLIFATDIDELAIEIARAGVYPDSITKDLPAELLERHFLKEDDRYRVSKDIRQMCLFSAHDLVKDPPFSRLDLISCRNVMIYFAQILQKRVVTLFHYGLRVGGVLFMGSSEAVASHSRLFAPLDKKHRLFVRRDGPRHPILGRDVPARVSASAAREPERESEHVPRLAQLMSRYLPAHVVTDRQHSVVQFSGNVGKFLDPTIDASNLELLGLVQVPLRAPLRAALREAASTQQRVLQQAPFIDSDTRQRRVQLIVEPLNPSDTADEARFVVIFQEADATRSEESDLAAAPEVVPGKDLALAREQLQTLTEELEAANEELQSSNEEYQSVNEELQSLNEELETSKEELQSINEELGTVNAELNVRNENLADINSDLRNLIDSTAIATLFLDEQLRIKRFTPAVLDIFNVREGDEGRPITDIVSRLARDGLQRDAQNVLHNLLPVTREVSLIGGEHTYQMVVRPYRNVNNVVNGIVVTFSDISERKRSERDRAKLAAIVDSSLDAIISHDLHGAITSWNTGASRIYGYSAAEALGMSMAVLLDERQRAEWPNLLAQLIAGNAVEHFDTTRTMKDGHLVDVSMTLSPILDSAGLVIGASAVGRDVTDRKHAEQNAALLLGELDHRVKNILSVISAVVVQTLHGNPEPAEFAEKVQNRISAIARAHSLLTHDGGHGAPLRAIVQTELAPYAEREGRTSITGPLVTLTPKFSFALAMAIHELTTNSAKYGALSASSGSVLVSWEPIMQGASKHLRLVWIETDGPPVQPPMRRGFGSTLIERALSYEFDAKVSRTFDPSGLRCTIEMPLTETFGHLGERPERET